MAFPLRPEGRRGKGRWVAKALRTRTKLARRLRRDATNKRRTGELAQRGYRIVRFWNHEVLDNLEGVLETILGALGSDPPPLTPLP